MQRISILRADILPAILIAAVPLAFLAVISLYQVFGNATDARSVHEKILNSFFVVRTTSDLCGEIQSAERGQRGYLITGREDYLEPYEKAKKRIPQLLSDLQQATLDNPNQHMPAEGRRAAAFDRRHDLQLAEAEVAGVGLAPRRSAVAEDMGAGTSYPCRRSPRSTNAISSTGRSADVSSGEYPAMHCIRRVKARNPWRTKSPGRPKMK